MRPLGNRVLLEPVKVENKTESGIYIPESAKKKPKTAVVKAVGDGELIKVKVGDRVIHEDFGAKELEIEDRKYLIMDVKDILAVVE